MSATFWLVIAIIAFSVAGISFVAAIVMFIFMKIPSVIGDLTGKTVAREVKAIRAENREKDIRHQSHSSTPKNLIQNNPLTKKEDLLADSEKSKKRPDRASSQPQKLKTDMLNIATDKLNNENKEKITTASLSSEIQVITEELTDVLGENATTVLESDATTVLESDATTVLESDATTVLESDATTVLSVAEGTTVLNVINEASEVWQGFRVVEEEIIIHTKEVIT